MRIDLKNRFALVWLLLLTYAFPGTAAEQGTKTFAFVGPQYLMTAELATPRSFIVNFINLSDFVVVIQCSEFIYRGASGRYYIGQVFEDEYKDNRGETMKYRASVLLKGHSVAGLTLFGAFREVDQIEELSIRIGSKRFYLQPLEKADFEQLAAKVESLDLKNQSSREALQEANIEATGRSSRPMAPLNGTGTGRTS